MTEEREVYKGREIIIKTGEGPSGAKATEGIEEKPELYIDGKHITTVREPSGVFRAARLVFAPDFSLMDLAKKVIDYEEATSNER